MPYLTHIALEYTIVSTVEQHRYGLIYVEYLKKVLVLIIKINYTITPQKKYLRSRDLQYKYMQSLEGKK